MRPNFWVHHRNQLHIGGREADERIRHWQGNGNANWIPRRMPQIIMPREKRENHHSHLLSNERNGNGTVKKPGMLRRILNRIREEMRLGDGQENGKPHAKEMAMPPEPVALSHRSAIPHSFNGALEQLYEILRGIEGSQDAIKMIVPPACDISTMNALDFGILASVSRMIGRNVKTAELLAEAGRAVEQHLRGRKEPLAQLLERIAKAESGNAELFGQIRERAGRLHGMVCDSLASSVGEWKGEGKSPQQMLADALLAVVESKDGELGRNIQFAIAQAKMAARQDIEGELRYDLHELFLSSENEAGAMRNIGRLGALKEGETRAFVELLLQLDNEARSMFIREAERTASNARDEKSAVEARISSGNAHSAANGKGG
jgi:hypothetical protein